MTNRSRQRWRAALDQPLFTHAAHSAVLVAPPDTLRTAVGCRTRSDFNRQLNAAQAEGWLSPTPELSIDLERLDALLAQANELSDRAHHAAHRDITDLANHHITFSPGPNGHWLAVDADDSPVDLQRLAEVFGLRSLGTAQWRLTRIRRSLNQHEPTNEQTQLDSPTNTELPATPPLHRPQTQNPQTQDPTAEISNRILTQLETETDPATRRHLAAALAATLGQQTDQPLSQQPAGPTPQPSRAEPARDPRIDTIREQNATIRDTPPRGSLESVQEQEPILILPRDKPAKHREARSRTERNLTPSTNWGNNPAQLESIIRPLEAVTTALGPNARAALREWDPDEVSHAIGVLVDWVEGGMKIRNPSAYVANAARCGYLSLFPLTTTTTDEAAHRAATLQAATELWAQRAGQLPPQICLDAIDAAVGPAPGRPYDSDAHAAALVAAGTTNPAVLDHYAPTHPDQPTCEDLRGLSDADLETPA